MVYDFVFIVLVYRNIQDLVDFFSSFKVKNSKVVIVNSYFDNETEEQFELIAHSYNADYIKIPNKGYSFGNNVGCRFALDNYKFRYLVISNADILIEHMQVKDLVDSVITAPIIETLNGKKQNPYRPYKIFLFDHLQFFAYKYKFFFLIYILSAINKFLREIYILLDNRSKIYAAHGAFIIFPYSIIIQLFPLFNEEMFLFAEEEHLAHKAIEKGISINYNRSILIRHKEDGSVNFIKGSLDVVRRSFMSFYRYWYSSKYPNMTSIKYNSKSSKAK